MITLSRTGVGTADHANIIRDSDGSGILPIQGASDGATTYRILGRVSPDAPWFELRAAGTADFLETVTWVPYIRLDVTSGGGLVSVYIGEK